MMGSTGQRIAWIDHEMSERVNSTGSKHPDINTDRGLGLPPWICHLGYATLTNKALPARMDICLNTDHLAYLVGQFYV